METSSDAGLTVSIDDETGIISFEWDEETHPEYNFIKDFTDETFATMMREYIDRLGLTDHVQKTADDSTEVSAG
jgi:hypothetical protein